MSAASERWVGLNETNIILYYFHSDGAGRRFTPFLPNVSLTTVVTSNTVHDSRLGAQIVTSSPAVCCESSLKFVAAGCEDGKVSDHIRTLTIIALH